MKPPEVVRRRNLLGPIGTNTINNNNHNHNSIRPLGRRPVLFDIKNNYYDDDETTMRYACDIRLISLYAEREIKYDLMSIEHSKPLVRNYDLVRLLIVCLKSRTLVNICRETLLITVKGTNLDYIGVLQYKRLKRKKCDIVK